MLQHPHASGMAPPGWSPVGMMHVPQQGGGNAGQGWYKGYGGQSSMQHGEFIFVFHLIFCPIQNFWLLHFG